MARATNPIELTAKMHMTLYNTRDFVLVQFGSSMIISIWERELYTIYVSNRWSANTVL